MRKRHTLEIMGVHWLDAFAGYSIATRKRYRSDAPFEAIDCAGETDLCVQVAFENGTAASYADSFSSHLTRCETLILGD
jgi:hypothetical protein